MVEWEILSVIGSLGTAVATIVLVVLLWKTIQQFETTAKLSAVEMEFRFRPWSGPTGPIKKMEKSISDDCQFDINIKNYGELPANAVIAKFVSSSEPLSRESFQSDNVNSYDLGPVMPTMEKHYWFFIDSETWKKADSGTEPLHTGLYFEYNHGEKKSGYGMLSEYNPTTKNFVHKDMWIDTDKSQ